MTCHAFPISYSHDFVVPIIIHLENNFLAIWVFWVISLGIVWQCSARAELSSPNMGKLGNGTPWILAFPWTFLLVEAASIILRFLEMKISATTYLTDEIIIMSWLLSTSIFCFTIKLALNKVIALPYYIFLPKTLVYVHWCTNSFL